MYGTCRPFPSTTRTSAKSIDGPATMSEGRGIQRNSNQSGLAIGQRPHVSKWTHVDRGAACRHRRRFRGHDLARLDVAAVAPRGVAGFLNVDRRPDGLEVVARRLQSRVAVARHYRGAASFEINPRQIGEDRGDAVQLERRIVAVIDHQIDVRLASRGEGHAQSGGGEQHRRRLFEGWRCRRRWERACRS